MTKKITIEVSARHVHLTKDDLYELFGEGYVLNKRDNLSQPGQFAAEETVTLVGPKSKIEKVRILGPVRTQTQVEISKTDGYKLGISAPVRDSGNLEDSPGAILEGPKGKVELEKGVIYALRHIHASTDEAEELKLKDKDIISVETKGDRSVTFHSVLVRTNPNFKLAFHIDTDEANTADVINKDEGIIILDK